MADILIRPGRLKGTVEPPPSKSDTHRALIAASLAGGEALLSGLPALLPDDVQATMRCLEAFKRGDPLLNCGESGTTLRLLIPVAAALGAAERHTVIFNGTGRLPQRPLDEYLAIFAGHGVDLDFPANASLPLSIKGRLSGGEFQVSGHISSQYLSGLLLALPLLDEDSTIHLTSRLESAPYVDMTLRTLKAFGIIVKAVPEGYRIAGGQRYRPTPYQIEKDYSQAAFWLTANYAGSKLEVVGLPSASAQGDKAIVPLLDDFRQGRSAYEIDASQIPDLVPILAVAAALTPAETRIVNAGRLRLKESDRLLATHDAIDAIGATISQAADGLVIRGGKLLTGGTADSWADHRIAMSLAIAALSTDSGVLLQRAECVSKSYPDFFREFRRLGGDFDGIDRGPESKDQHLW